MNTRYEELRPEVTQCAHDAVSKQAAELLIDPEATDNLILDTLDKAEQNRDVIQGFWEDLKTLLRLVQAWKQGDYTEAPWRTIAAAVGAILYFVNPFDLIPDIIPGVGYLDDAGVIGFVIVSLEIEIATFREWEAGIQVEVSDDKLVE